MWQRGVVFCYVRGWLGWCWIDSVPGDKLCWVGNHNCWVMVSQPLVPDYDGWVISA